VLDDLEQHGFGLGALMRGCLLENPEPVAQVSQDSAMLEVRNAISFWPLLGDAVLQATRGARVVDSSILRMQVLVSAPRGRPLGQLGANGYSIPLVPVSPPRGERADRDYALGSVTYRAFVPQVGLHPEIPSHDPWVLEWVRGDSCQRILLHAWNPNGGIYDGLPRCAAEARERREERVIISSTEPKRFEQGGATGNRLDLRCIRC
jgi:uncharacterized protein (DUF2126 family)